MPDLRTVMRWLADKEDFRHQYAQAKEDQADTLAEDILHIADTPLQGETRKLGPNGNVVETRQAEMTEHRKLQIDARKWIAARLKPKKYGDKVDHTHGGDANRPIPLSFVAGKW